jgi:deoxyribonuclease-4
MSNELIFGTVGAPSSTPPKPGGSSGAIARIKELKLGALELAWVQSVVATDKTCAAIKAAAAEHGVALSVHAPYFINLNADSRQWSSSRERLTKAARAGFKAGATDIIFHPGTYFGQPPEQVYRVVRERLAGVMAELRAEGNTVTLRPETMGKSAMFGTLAETVQLSRDVEGVLPCIDFAHLHARRGDGSFNSYAEFLDALRLVAAGLGQRGLQHLHIHMSGIEYSAKGERNHLMLKEADIKYRDLLRALIDMGAGGRVMVESPDQQVDALLMQKAYRQILKTKSQISQGQGTGGKKQDAKGKG